VTKRRMRSWALAAEAWAEIATCRARLRLPRLLSADSLLRRELTAEPSGSPLAPPPDRLLQAFARALRAQPGAPGCLPRSLALRRFLARHGQPGHLALGLRRVAGRMHGHAWVEAEGRILTGDGRFAGSFFRLNVGGRCLSTAGRTDA
jgi:hypothetical protein